MMAGLDASQAVLSWCMFWGSLRISGAALKNDDFGADKRGC